MIQIPDWVMLIAAILATFKLGEIVVIETGPYGIFERFRATVGKSASKVTPGKRTFVTEFAALIHCPYCVGVWTSLLLVLLIAFRSIPGDVFILFMAIAGGQSLLQTLSARGYQD